MVAVTLIRGLVVPFSNQLVLSFNASGPGHGAAEAYISNEDDSDSDKNMKPCFDYWVCPGQIPHGVNPPFVIRLRYK